ncbi:MAG: hypothetical protein KAR05_00185 [Candidatus Omnitrophica bacterium]|nr:hypothetical protein [Candidatus Omnitrophota bacterium]
MAKKKKKTVWHKKRGKFIPSSTLKPRGKADKEGESPLSEEKQDRRKSFARDFLSQIKKGVKKDGE